MTLLLVVLALAMAAGLGVGLLQWLAMQAAIKAGSTVVEPDEEVKQRRRRVRRKLAGLVPNDNSSSVDDASTATSAEVPTPAAEPGPLGGEGHQLEQPAAAPVPEDVRF